MKRITTGCAICPYRRCNGCYQAETQGGTCDMVPRAQGCCTMSIRAGDPAKGCYWGEKGLELCRKR